MDLIPRRTTPQANRYAIPDAQGVIPIWNTKTLNYEYPADSRLTIMDQRNKLLKAILQGGVVAGYPGMMR